MNSEIDMEDQSYHEVINNPSRFSLAECIEALLEGFKPDYLKSSKLNHCLEALKFDRPVADQQAIDYILGSAENDGVYNEEFDSESSRVYLEWALQTVENGDHNNHFDRY